MKKKYGYWIFTCALVASLCFGGYEYMRAKELEYAVSNSYNRAFFELSDYVDDINTLLAKGLLVNSPAHFAAISSELSRQSAAAKECLSQLPLSDVSLEKTEKFLSQVGDYSFYLSQNALYDTEMTDEEYQSLSQMSSYASSLSAALNSLQQDMYNGNLNFNKNKTGAALVAYAAENSMDGFSAIEKEFGEYPALIYDGPFSEHIENLHPVMCENAEEISAETAAMIANEFLGMKNGFISYEGLSENSSINCYTFSTGNNLCAVSITQKGGYIIYYLNNREIGAEQLDAVQAISSAKDFLNAHGYYNMNESYYEKSDGSITINFAYTQDDITCYSDLVKVKVALDNGEIIGLETNGYIMNHSERDMPEVKLSRQEARSYVSKHLAIDSARLALIPKDSMREVLCYEFKGTSNGRNFLIYINAQNGREEDIRLLIESENGTLTV